MLKLVAIIAIIVCALFTLSNIALVRKIKKQFRCTHCNKLNNTLNRKCEHCGKEIIRPKMAYKSMIIKSNYRDEKGNQILKKELHLIYLDTAIYLMCITLAIILITANN